MITIIQFDWLAESASLWMGGATLVIFLCRWCTIGKFLKPMGSKRVWQKKSIKQCCPIGSQDTWTKYTLLSAHTCSRYATFLYGSGCRLGCRSGCESVRKSSMTFVQRWNHIGERTLILYGPCCFLLVHWLTYWFLFVHSGHSPS